MKYLNPTFSCPAAPSKVTQEEWDRIFGVASDIRRPQAGSTGDAFRRITSESSIGEPNGASGRLWHEQLREYK